MFGINNELLGIMKSGCHFSNTIEGSNYNNKRIVHIVARTLTIVGVLQQKDLNLLFDAYPSWKQRILMVNGFMHKIGVRNMTKYVKAINMENTITN